MKHLFFILLLFIAFDISAQRYPDEFPIDGTIQDQDAVYTQEKIAGTRTPRKFLMQDIKDYVLQGIPSVIVGRDELADSIASVLIQAFEKDDSLYMVTDESQLATISQPIQNDIAMNTAKDSIWIYSNSIWNPFSGGGGAIVNRDSLTTHPYLRQFRSSVFTGSFDVAFLGDSRTEFNHTTKALRKQIFDSGLEYGGYGLVSFTYAAVSDLNVSTTGSVIDKTGVGLESTFGKARVLSIGDSYAINTVNDIGKFEEIEIYYFAQAGAGSFDISIDGVFNQTVDGSSPLGVQKITISGLTDTNHSFSIDNIIGGDITLLEYVLTRTNGFRVHAIGNSGGSTSHFANDFLNTHFYSDYLPDLAIIRLGVNGGDMANVTTATTSANNLKIIRDRILSVSPNTNSIWTGEGKNATYTTDQTKIFNQIISTKADSFNIAFFNMFEIIPDWGDFNAEGFGDATVHENSLGGNIIGQWYYKKLISGEYEGIEQSKVSDGTLNRLAYYSDTDAINSSNIYTDGSKIVINGTNTNQVNGISVQGTNEQLASFGSGTTNPLFTLNDKSGYLSMNWFSKYEHPDWISVGSTLIPMQLTRDLTSFRLNSADQTTVGNALTWKSLFVAHAGNRAFFFNDPTTAGQFQIRHGTRTQNWQQYLDLTNTEMKFDNNDAGRNIDFAFGGVTEVSMRNNKTVFNSPIQLLGTTTTPQVGYVWKATDTSGNGDWQAESGGGSSIWETSSTGIIPSNSVDKIALGAAIQNNRSIVTGGNVDFNGLVMGVSGGSTIINGNDQNLTISNYPEGWNMSFRTTKTGGAANTFFTNSPDDDYTLFSGSIAFNDVGQSGTPEGSLTVRSKGSTSTTKAIAVRNLSNSILLEVLDDGEINADWSTVSLSEFNNDLIANDVAEVTDINSPYLLSATEVTVFVDCTNGSASVTLLQGAAMAGKKILFVRKDNQGGNSVTIIASTGSILGPVSLDSQYETQGFVSDGTNYYAY